MCLFELMLSNSLDIDQCAMGLDECSDDAACTDTDGSYECTCNSGFTGDGFTCTSKSIIPTLFSVYQCIRTFRNSSDIHLNMCLKHLHVCM